MSALPTSTEGTGAPSEELFSQVIALLQEALDKLDSLGAPAEIGARVEASLSLLKEHCESTQERQNPTGPKERGAVRPSLI
jgi:RecB family exonuclease